MSKALRRIVRKRLNRTKLEGTIYTAAEEIALLTGQGIAYTGDIRSEESIEHIVKPLQRPLRH